MNSLALAVNPLWYAGRAAGTIALLLLTVTVVLGVTVAGKAAPRRIGRFELGRLHRDLSVLSLVFLTLHIVTVIVDPFTHLSWTAVCLPFGASYRPLWLGLGAVAVDLLLAVAVTSALRLRLGRRWWKAVHWLVYAAWPLGLVHAIGAGTDTRLPLQLWLYAAGLACTVAAVSWRLYRAGPGHAALRLAAAAAAIAVLCLVTVFLAAGPLRPGWSHRAAASLAFLAGVIR